MKILVTGASGLVGRRLVPRLLCGGNSVTVFVRSATVPFEPSEGLTVVLGTIEDAAAVERAAAGCDAVVHLANATAVRDPVRVQAINVGGTEHVLAAARHAGARRIVFTSTISAMRERLGPYGASKRSAEERVRGGGVPFVILRPSLVYGELATGLVASLTQHLRALPVMPVIGNGRIELDPVHIDDLCAVIEACLLRDDVVGRTYDVVGPDRVTLNDFLRLLGEAVGVHRPLLHLPGGASLILARVLGTVMAQPPLTVDNVLGLISPAHIDRDAALRDFPIAWTPLATGLRAMFAR